MTDVGIYSLLRRAASKIYIKFHLSMSARLMLQFHYTALARESDLEGQMRKGVGFGI